MNAIKSIDCIEPRVSRIQRNLNLNVRQLVPKLRMSPGVGLDGMHGKVKNSIPDMTLAWVHQRECKHKQKMVCKRGE